MAYTSLTSADLVSKKPVKQELWTTVKNDLDDHETRLLALEATGLIVPPIQFIVQGTHYFFGAQTGVCFVRVPYSITLTDAKLYIPDVGSSGTLEVDIQKKSGAGAFATVFSTKPSLAFGAGDHSTSTNAVLSVTTVTAGDFLRLDISQVQTGCIEFHLYLYHELS